MLIAVEERYFMINLNFISVVQLMEARKYFQYVKPTLYKENKKKSQDSKPIIAFHNEVNLLYRRISGHLNANAS